MTVAVAALACAAYILNTPFVYCDSDSSTNSPDATEQSVPTRRPFEFAFESNDGLGTTQHRRESVDAGGAVTGAYGYLDALGVYRVVEYVADEGGFRAVVKTNEPGTAPQSTADAVWIVQAPPDIHPPLYPPPGAGRQKFPSSRQFQLKENKANVTSEGKMTDSGVLYGSPPVRPFYFPALSQTKGVITIQLPVTQRSGKRTVKLVPRDVRS